MTALYNEIDPYAAQWLRNLIAAGYIADGVVDERSISDLAPTDVAGPGQRHFFAGIAGWSHALRLAGVPDDASIWTGSCPCQPFSDAGRRGGFDDERHLWPAWFRLIRERRPAIVFGEQVASDLGWWWFDRVCADMENADYACAAACLPAAGAGAEHIRHRIFWVANAMRRGLARSIASRSGVRSSEISTPAVSRHDFLHPRIRIHPDSVPVEPADGFPRPVGFVRAVGNAIDQRIAAAFIHGALESP